MFQVTRKKKRRKDTLIGSIQDTRHNVGGGESEEIVPKTRFSHILEDNGSIEMVLFRVELVNHLQSSLLKLLRVELRIPPLHIEDTIIIGHILAVVIGRNRNDTFYHFRLNRYYLRIIYSRDRQSHKDDEGLERKRKETTEDEE